MRHTADVGIIGGGPVGLFAIFECGMHNLSCAVIDTLPEVGGQCSTLYPEKPIYDIPAYPTILAGELIRQLEAQARPFNPRFYLNQQVTHIIPREDGWHLKTSKDQELVVKCILIAGGVGAFGPKKPPLENIEAYENKSIFYFIKNKEMFRDKRVVIAGGGDSAVDWALELKDIAAKVMFVHRRPKFRATPDTTEKLHQAAAKGQIELVVPYQLEALEGRNGMLTAVRVKTLDGQITTLSADFLLPFFGLSMNLGPIAEWGLTLDHNHIPVDPGTCATSTPGVYAIGDIAIYPHKQKLILSGFAESAQAAHAMRRFLYPNEVVHFEYSTTKGAPGFSS